MAVEVVESFRSDARLFSLSFLNVPETLNEMFQNVWDLEKRFLLPQFVTFSRENEQLASL